MNRLYTRISKFMSYILRHHPERFNIELDADGYTYVKIANPRKWILKHRKIWIDNFGEIPESHAVIFLDGNKQNFDLFNLILVHRRDTYSIMIIFIGE